MKRKIRWSRTTVALLVTLLIVTFLFNFERIHLLIVARPATEQELAWVLERSGWPAAGQYHRWKNNEGGWPTPVGTWYKYYGNSGVVRSKVVFDLFGEKKRETQWLPDGSIFEQWDYRGSGNWIKSPAWKWGEEEQLISTKSLRGCRLQNLCLDGLDLGSADLREADMFCSTLLGTNLTRADLRAANAQRCDFRDADLRDARLDGTFLYGSDLSRVRSLTIKQVLSATWDNRMPDLPTKFPPGIDKELLGLGIRYRGVQ